MAGGRMTRVRIGMLGLGRIADLQCLGYREHPQATLAAVCDLDEARARARAAAWNVPRVYTRPEQLFADPEIDAVDIATPHHLHAEHAIAALEAARSHRDLRTARDAALAEQRALPASVSRVTGREHHDALALLDR